MIPIPPALFVAWRETCARGACGGRRGPGRQSAWVKVACGDSYEHALRLALGLGIPTDELIVLAHGRDPNASDAWQRWQTWIPFIERHLDLGATLHDVARLVGRQLGDNVTATCVRRWLRAAGKPVPPAKRR